MIDLQQVIYFVRHGETTWNLEGRMQGHLDAPLTARGLREAHRDGAALRNLIEDDEPYALVFSPPRPPSGAPTLATVAVRVRRVPCTSRIGLT